MIPLHEPFVGKDEAKAAAECVRSGWVSSAGPQVAKFEQEFSELVGRPAAAVSSGTAALHLALLLAGVGPGDKVLVPAMTFVATANAVVYCGAEPVFIDVCNTGHMSSEALRGWLRDNSAGCVKAVIVTHLFGLANAVDQIRALLDSFDIPLIEDAAQAIGRRYNGQPVGSFGQLGCFSFNGNKTVTCGGGGMLVGDQQHIDEAKYLSTQAVDDPICFDHHAVGFNYRMTAVAAAIGSVQLAKLDRITELKAVVYGRYDEAFRGRAVCWSVTVPWLYTLTVQDAQRTVQALRDDGIGARRAWMPLPMTKAYSRFRVECSTANEIHQHLVCLPSSPGLSKADQSRVIKSVLGAM